MKIKITSDSTCDLTPELLKRFDISICPLYVIMDGVSYRDGIDITTDQIFAHVAEGGSLCSTAAVSEDDYKHFFARELEGYDGLVHITISSEMSACYQNALRAARKFENIHVVDSRNLSSAQGLLVMEGAEMAQRGDMTAEEIGKALRELTPKIDGSFVVDRLEYLRKGGRCSTAAATRKRRPACAVRPKRKMSHTRFNAMTEGPPNSKPPASAISCWSMMC